MTTRPIIFSAPMVRAILEGRKTQTRRVLKHGWAPENRIVSLPDGPNKGLRVVPCAPGDRLWVREAFRAHEGGTIRDPGSGFVVDHIDPEIEYKADCATPRGKWKPSIHMPRWASRITLTVTAVRVERLQEISGADAKAEGVSIPAHLPEDGADLDHARRSFITLWTSIHGPRSWDANPWVAAISFTAEQKNIDA